MRTPKVRYLQRRKLDRLRHSEQLEMWLAAQALLLQQTVAQVYAPLESTSATEVEAVPTPPVSP